MAPLPGNDWGSNCPVDEEATDGEEDDGDEEYEEDEADEVGEEEDQEDGNLEDDFLDEEDWEDGLEDSEFATSFGSECPRPHLWPDPFDEGTEASSPPSSARSVVPLVGSLPQEHAPLLQPAALSAHEDYEVSDDQFEQLVAAGILLPDSAEVEQDLHAEDDFVVSDEQFEQLVAAGALLEDSVARAVCLMPPDVLGAGCPTQLLRSSEDSVVSDDLEHSALNATRPSSGTSAAESTASVAERSSPTAAASETAASGTFARTAEHAAPGKERPQSSASLTRPRPIPDQDKVLTHRKERKGPPVKAPVVRAPGSRSPAVEANSIASKPRPPPPPPPPKAIASKEVQKLPAHQCTTRRTRSVDCALITKSKAKRDKNKACGGGLFFLPTDGAAPISLSRGGSRGSSSADPWQGGTLASRNGSPAASSGSRSSSAYADNQEIAGVASEATGLACRAPAAAGAPLHSARLLRELRPTSPRWSEAQVIEQQRSSSVPASLPQSAGSSAGSLTGPSADGQRVRRRPPRVPMGKMARLGPTPPELPAPPRMRSSANGGSSRLAGIAAGADSTTKADEHAASLSLEAAVARSGLADDHGQS